ncbi:MAG: nicotinate (nicotinamide) nucleotide adenylyltransferase [Candidatus Nanopelagicaceae bacterium]
MKIGIYGGTFDPIHNGHLRVVVELLTRKVVEKIILVPAGAPQLRQSTPTADGATRFRMCQLAIEDLPESIKGQVAVSDLEILREGPSFAIDTINQIKDQNLKDEFFWIIGSDAYEKIDSWHRAAELKESVSFIVIDRPGGESDGLDIGALDISATQIRADRAVHGVSPSVRKFIQERKLYASK